jgi:hypothetical protein
MAVIPAKAEALYNGECRSIHLHVASEQMDFRFRGNDDRSYVPFPGARGHQDLTLVIKLTHLSHLIATPYLCNTRVVGIT